jgi:hypothetical protein
MKLSSKGNRVSHHQYGSGTITTSDERYTVIEFDQHGKKTFLSNKVELTASDEPEPNKPAKTRKKAAPKTPKAPKA